MRLPRIVYVTPNAVLPPNRGGRIRAHHLWRALSAFGDVTPIVVGDMPPAHIRRMSRLADAAYYPRRPYRLAALQDALRAAKQIIAPGLFEVVEAEYLPEDLWDILGDPESLIRHCLNASRTERVARHIRRLRPDLVVLCDTSLGLLAPHIKAMGIKVVVSPHNFDSELYTTMAANAPDERLRNWNASAAKAFEAAEKIFAPVVDQLWVCSRADRDRFEASGIRRDRIVLVPNVYDVGLPTPLPESSNDLVFVGQGNYYPNTDAISRLYRISRELDSRGVGHRMRIVGRIPAHLRAMAAQAPSVEVLGEVPEIGPYVQNAVIAPIALTLGGGTRLKILEAMAMGRVVLSTPIGIEGIEVENGVHAVVEPDLDEFPRQIMELFADRERAQKIADAGWAFAREHYSHEALLVRIGEALQAIGVNGATHSDTIFARNVGAKLIDERASFSPFSRLLSWDLTIDLAASHDVLVGELAVEGQETVSNAFVTIKQRPKGYVGLECVAILAPGASLENVSVKLYAWGREVLAHKLPEAVDCQTAGMVSLQLENDRIELLGWTASDSEAAIVPAPQELAEPIAIATEALSLYRSLHSDPAEVLEAEAIGISTGAGHGQALNNPRSWLGPHSASSARLQRLRNKHQGETAWLIGNGPSVRIEDLDKLQGRVTFAFNRFHLAYGTTQLRPSYTLTGDKQMIEDFGQQIVDEAGGTVFISHDEAPDLLGDYIWLRQLAFFPPLFSTSPEQMVSPGGSTPFVAMQLAYYMGIRKMYFYGVDFSFKFERHTGGGDNFRIAKGDGNHFIPNYRSGKPWCPPSLKDIGSSFIAARLILEANGGFIRNVTRGGMLEMFERDDFDVAVAAN